MSLHFIYPISTAFVLMSGAATWAQSQQPPSTPSTTTTQVSTEQATPITLYGCVQRESDYRRAMDAGKGGAVGTGAGTGNEFILVNATRESATGASRPDCSAMSTNDAYELTGSGEGALAQFVGRYVEVTGTLKKMDHPADPARAAGGNPLSQELHLAEVNVASSREVAAERVTETAAVEPPPSQPPATTPTPAPAPTPTTETTTTRAALPHTASLVPLVGLIGLLSLGGAAAVRGMRN